MCKKIEGSCQAPLDINLVEYICEEGFDVGEDLNWHENSLARQFGYQIKVTLLKYGNDKSTDF